MITYKTTDSTAELEAIIQLQKSNLPHNITNTEKQTQGFVTVQHTLELLQKMQNAYPHIIAIHNDKVVGYALSMLQDFKEDIPVLTPMFLEIDSVINHSNYMVMGQICIDKNYRKQGIFRGLYSFMSQTVKNDFKAIVTEVDATNRRSSNAHSAVGFQLLKTYVSKGQEWELLMLEV